MDTEAPGKILNGKPIRYSVASTNWTNRLRQRIVRISEPSIALHHTAITIVIIFCGHQNRLKRLSLGEACRFYQTQ